MSNFISQKTFDDVVEENVVEFSMDVVEAREETIKQFESQAVNLSNIVKDLDINSETGKPILNEVIEHLKQHVGQKYNNEEKLIESLNFLQRECEKSLAHRVLAGKNGASEALRALLELEINSLITSPNREVVQHILQALNSLNNKQPDLFDAEDLTMIFKLLKTENESIQCLALQWLQKATVMHEKNRQNIVHAGIVKELKPLIVKNQKIRLLRDILAALRNLVLDDDIRVEFGNAHEHARQISSELIVDLTKMLNEYSDELVLADLLLTIGMLTVRQEFCTVIEDADGLEYIFKIMTAHKDKSRVSREALKLVRALAGNDLVKVHTVQKGVAPIIRDILHNHKTNEQVVTAALAAISTLTLRVKENSLNFFEAGIAEMIVECMQLHSKNKIIQRNAAWSIRNMVSRSREQCEIWLSYGIEDILNNAINEHPSIAQDIKAALRDLGCKLTLREEWTGVAEKKIHNA